MSQLNIQNLSSGRLSLDIKIPEGGANDGRILRSSLGPGDIVDASAAPVFAIMEELNNHTEIQRLVANGTISVTAVADTTDIGSPETQWNNLRDDLVTAMVAASSTLFHKTNPTSITIEGLPDATDLPTVILLANSLKGKANAHLLSAGAVGAHRIAAAATIGAADATDQATVETLLNEIKADYNTHLAEANVHIGNDGTNDVTSADASNLATSLTLANEIKLDFNAHIAAANAMASDPVGSN